MPETSRIEYAIEVPKESRASVSVQHADGHTAITVEPTSIEPINISIHEVPPRTRAV
ncbi:hypothetical protein [Streptomyces viridochromogenes]|uniref:Uncharacterized protein n=1 Tax=Streptomyces viridochromogenes Tue57 TaxID=1160705 RepID=L8P7I9_STRVR|nr:hypothetical protein [Streptomyces viridochromogenes]ELS53571.1 hypothetical protein STVIR_5491 [Streptomyces viridochromogenes Tue57]